MDKLYWLLSAFVLTLFVIVLRAALGKRMNPGLRYALWGLVLLRLLIPGTVLHSRVSVATATDRAMDTAVLQSVDQYITETPVYAGSINRTEMSPEEAIAAHPDGWLHEINDLNCKRNETHNYIFHDTLKNQGAKVLLQLWRVGMILTAAVFLVSNLRLYFRLRRNRRPLEPHAGRRVYVVDGLSSSCLFLGSIYVSAATAADAAALNDVLAHEAAHARHGDDFWALLRCAALVLYWFDPLVWYAAKLSQRDSELFADAGALKTLEEDAAERYGETLIRLSAGCPKRTAPLCTATAMCSGKKALRERITQIAKRPRMKGMALAAVLLLCISAVGFAFVGSAKAEEAPNTPAETEPTAAPSTPGDLSPIDPGNDGAELQQETFTVSTPWDYDAVMALYAEACAEKLGQSAAQVTPVSVGDWRQMVSFQEDPQRFSFDISLELVPASGAEEQLRAMENVQEHDGRWYYESEAVLTSADGLHWHCDDAAYGGGVGWRGYRLLYVNPAYVGELIDKVAAAYQRGDVASAPCDQLLWCGEFLSWEQLTRDGHLDAVYQALREAAVDESYPTLGPINDDHLYRDLYMLYAASHTDGAFAELFADFIGIAYGDADKGYRYTDDCLLGIQYYNDPDAFQYALSTLPEQMRLRLSPLLQSQVAAPSPDPVPTATPEPAVSTPEPDPDALPFASYGLPTVRYTEESYDAYMEQRSNGMTVLEEIDTGLCRILSWCYYGTPHGTSASLVVFYPDATVTLPLPPRSAWQMADPAENLRLSGDGRALTYTASFEETLTDVSGEYIIHKAGTYYYTYDLAARTVSLEIVPK